MSLWVEKYKPTDIKNIIGNTLQIKRCEMWLSNFKNRKDNTHYALLISGPPGIGKTTLSYLLLQKYKYDVLEFNASDIRNQKLIKEKFNNIIGKNSISSLMGGNKYNGIIMDEVDGLSSGDKGGLSELLSFINPKKRLLKYNNPIICICNTNYDKKIKELKKYCNHIVFTLPKLNDLFKCAQYINKKEDMKLSEDYLLKIVNYSQNDIRKLINTLELFNKKKNLHIDIFLENLNQKNKHIDLYSSVFTIFDTYTSVNNILKIHSKDRNLINLLIHHNILVFIENYKINNKEKLLCIEKIYKCFYESDLYDNFIFNTHYYDLNDYNGCVKCCEVSYILNKNKRLSYQKNNINNITFSNILNKFSLQLYNYKTKYYILNKININSSYLNNDEIFTIIILHIINYSNNYKININYNKEIINFIKLFNLDSSDLEKIYKLVKNKIIKTKKENHFTTLANNPLDKKYFNKFMKLIQ